MLYPALSTRVIDGVIALRRASGPAIPDLKSATEQYSVMRAQVLGYLRISGVKLGVLVNFQGARPLWERFVV